MAGHIHTGVDWRETGRPPLEPGDSVHFGDLRGCRLTRADLTDVELLGCRLNDTSLRATHLRGARFVGCFAADALPPLDLRGADSDGLDVVDSHLHVVSDGAGSWRWPQVLAEAAAGTLSERVDERRRSAIELARLDDQRAAYVLACLLGDVHWQVRLATVRALASLYHGGFEHHDEALKAVIFRRLGDEHSLVRMEVRRLIGTLAASRDVLRGLLVGAHSKVAGDRVETLRAAVELARLDEEYVRLEDLPNLIGDASPEVRAEYVHLLGVLDVNAPSLWSKALADADPGVRVQALQALRLLSEPPLAAATLVLPLRNDPHEEVRSESQYTLGQLGYADPD